MITETKTTALSALREAIQILSKANAQLFQNKEEVAKIEAIQYDLLQIAIKVIEKPKLEEIICFLKAVKHLWYIPDSLIKQLSLKFNCDFETLKFQIQWNSHSQNFHTYNHEENI
jgi:hypothetical protein